jgi:hypothetical protein
MAGDGAARSGDLTDSELAGLGAPIEAGHLPIAQGRIRGDLAVAAGTPRRPGSNWSYVDFREKYRHIPGICLSGQHVVAGLLRCYVDELITGW